MVTHAPTMPSTLGGQCAYARPMSSQAWRWLSYNEPCWVWPVDEIGGDYFDDEQALDQAIFTVAVRQCLLDLQTFLPERLLLGLVNQLRHTVELVQADIVAEARSKRISWTRMGVQLGVGRTAAQKRYGHGLSHERRRQLELETKAAMKWAREVVAEAIEEEDDDEPAEAAQNFLDQITKRRRRTQPARS
jgi:hypothetical protein